jgi:hypothetical protein
VADNSQKTSMLRVLMHWDKCINVGEGCQEVNVFSRFEYHVLQFISICDLFTDSPSYFFSHGLFC